MPGYTVVDMFKDITGINKYDDKGNLMSDYNMEKSGNQGKVGNPDTSPAPMSTQGLNQPPKPMKMDNK